jgi:hypothetical protein
LVTPPRRMKNIKSRPPATRMRETRAKMFPGASRQLRESCTGRIPGDLLLAIVVLAGVEARDAGRRKAQLVAAGRWTFSGSSVSGR